MQYHIALISDDNYVLPTSVCIKSIINSNGNHDDCNVIIHVCTFGLTDKNAHYLKQLSCENITIVIDLFCKEQYEGKIMQIDQKTHVTPTALIKFDLHNYFDNIDKLLYLDGDIIVKNNIFPLLNTNIDDYYLAASFELWKYIEYEKYRFGFGGLQFYFNSGVMLLNLNKLRADNITEKLWYYKINHAKTNLMDQESLNAVCGKRTLQLPIKWNFNPAFLSEEYFRTISKVYGTRYNKLNDLEKDSAILHYVGTYDKPWKYIGARMAKYWMETYQSMPLNEPLRLINIPPDSNSAHIIERIKAFGLISVFGYIWYTLKIKLTK